MRSIRARLLVGMIVSVAALLALFGTVVYFTIRTALYAEFDASLLSAARAMAASVESEDGEVDVEVDDGKTAPLKDGEPPLYFQFWLADGTALHRSRNLGAAELPRFHGRGATPEYRAITLPNGRPARALGLRFAPRVDGGETLDLRSDWTRRSTTVTLVVARSVSALETRLGLFLRLLIAAGVSIMAVAALVSFEVVGSGLRPLRALANSIEGINEQALSGRIPDDRAPTELRPVIGKLNELLQRLEVAFARERGFTSDVAHELRTPLAGLRATVDVALAREREPGAYAQALRDALGIVELMESLVERLLLLARLDEGGLDLKPEDVAVHDLVDACWESFAARAAERGLRFTNLTPAELTCRTDPDCLLMILTNLLDNAAEYAETDGAVCVGGREAAGVELEVTNTGCAMGPDEVAQVFERFWRADASRQGTGVHVGLGMALVRRVADALGGTVEAAVDEDRVFRVRVSLPDL